MKTLFEDTVGREDTHATLLIRVVNVALRMAARSVREYSDKKSPKVFTQRQLVACLLLKTYLRTTYRGVAEQLTLMPAVREAIGLKQVPHWTTLQKFADRANILTLVDRALKELGREVLGGATPEAAMDSTGVETTCASAHFVSRRGNKRGKFVKLSIVALCGLVMPVALVVGWGPGSDHTDAVTLARKAARVLTPRTLWCDKGYDSEAFHQHCWNTWGTISFAPARMREGQVVVSGDHRWMMKEKWPGYGRRWHVESVNSGMKRTVGSTLAARTERTLFHEAALKVLTYAIRV